MKKDFFLTIGHQGLIDTNIYVQSMGPKGNWWIK